MTATTDLHQRTATLRRAAVRATLAPSVHNTQPWHFVLGPAVLDILADPERQLRELDPTGRQLLISVGCAIFNARVAIAAAGMAAEVDRLPTDEPRNLVARITAVPASGDYVDPIGELDRVVEARQTNRRHFSDDEVPSEIIAQLVAAAEAEGAHLYVVHGDDDRQTVAMLSQRADAIQNLNPAYRAELRAWTSDDPNRVDGVPAMSVPHVDGHAEDEIPIRDFDTHGKGWLPSTTRSSRNQCLLLLGTDGDNRDSWLHAGEALERVLLEITKNGYAASPLTQIVEVASARDALRRELRLTMYPHVLLRVGRAPATPSPRRRRLVDVLEERN